MVTGRASRVREAMGEHGVDALVVTDLLAVRWLTGFAGSAGTLILDPVNSLLITDGRYAQQAREQMRASGASTDVIEVRSSAAMFDAMVNALNKCKRIGLDLDHVSVRLYEHLRTAGMAIVDAGGLLADARRIKDVAEIERIERACRAADDALAIVSPMLMGASPMSERDVRDELEYCMRLCGADGPSYDTIVASGENAAHPHHRPTDRRIVEGDCVLIDVGALVDGYHSDMAGTFLLGDVDDELRRMYDVVARVQSMVRESIRPGISGDAVAARCREGFGADANLFLHGVGHGVGLHIHESPWLRAGWDHPLQVGEVVTVEPGLYRVGLGGVRIEDLVLVEPTGCRTLTHSPKDPQCPRLAPMT